MEIYYLAPTLFIFVFFIYKFLRPQIFIRKAKLNKSFYRVVYSDAKNKKTNVGYIKSKKYNLRGKPDYILKHILFNTYIPAELKSGKIGDDGEPHFGDLMQLICYFVMIEEFYSCKVPYGKLIYADKMFIIRNTKKYRNTLKYILNEMDTFDIKKCNDEPSKKICGRCQYKHTVCTYYQKSKK